MAIITAPSYAKSVHDAVCMAFGLPLNCGDFEIKLYNFGSSFYEVVQFNELFDGQYFDVDRENGCYTFTPDAAQA